MSEPSTSETNTFTPSIAIVVGTRPEVIKMAPVCRALYDFPYTLYAVQQQRDLVDQHMSEEGLRPQIIPIHRSSSDLNDLLPQVITAVSAALTAARPRVVVVHGDTTTALGAAIAAFHLQIPVAHVEAGLRTPDHLMPFPEEANRRMISSIASLHFAPTNLALRNLHDADINRIFVTGNTGIDAYYNALNKDRNVPLFLPEMDEDKRLILVTCHRRENWHHVESLAYALRQLAAQGHHIMWPLHPNPAIVSAVKGALLAPSALCGIDKHIHLMFALPYEVMVKLLGNVDLVITDSGGVIEEAAEACVPCVILRSVTERPEALDRRCTLCPIDSPDLLDHLTRALVDDGQRDSMGKFGDGMAGSRIANHLVDFVQELP